MYLQLNKWQNSDAKFFNSDFIFFVNIPNLDDMFQVRAFVGFLQ